MAKQNRGVYNNQGGVWQNKAVSSNKTDWDKVAQRRVENEHAIKRTEEAVNRLRETLTPRTNK